MKQTILSRSLTLFLVMSTLPSLAIEAPANAASAASGATAPAPAVSAPAMSVAQILDRNAQARGGLAAWRKVQGFAYVGKMDAGRKRPDPDSQFADPNASPKDRRKERIVRDRELADAPVIQLPFSLEVARGRKSRLEVSVNGQTAVQVFDGTAGWKLRPWLAPSLQAQGYTAEELKLASDQADIDGWLIDAKAKGNKVAAEGVEAVDGKPAYKLKVSLPNGDVRHVWVDAETFLDVKVEGARRFNGKVKPMYTALKDFRAVDGVQVPFLMETSMEGFRDTERIVIEKATLNPALGADRFSKPK
jgi:hypothetical protein